jgi:trk system potassium uptake protein TrkA
LRIVIVGTSRLARATAAVLITKKHEVVVVDRDRDQLDALGEELDCGLIEGDGTSPATLREAAGESPDVLLALTEHDQTNILAALLGRSVGFARAIPQILQPDLNPVCHELGLDDTIAPHETMGRHLAETVLGEESLSVTALNEHGARLMAIAVEDGGPRRVADLELPERARAICVLDGDGFALPSDTTELALGDRIVVLTDGGGIDALRRRYR